MGRPRLDDPVALFAVFGGAGRQQVQALGLRGQLQHVGLGQGLGRGAVQAGLGGQYAFQAQPGDQGADLQIQHQPHGGGLVAFPGPIGPLGRLDGGVGADGTQSVAELCVLPAGLQIGPLPRLDEGVIQMGVYLLQAAEMLDQGQGSLFTDALHPGDVVGRIPHQALDVDQLPGLQTVLGLDGGLVHHPGLTVAPAGGGQQHGGVIAHQLQVVPVTGGQIAGFLALVAGGGQSAQDVVGLPALGGHQLVAQKGQQLLEQGHLGGQLLGHTVAVGLVAVVHLVAEGRGGQVKGNGHLVRLIVLGQGEQDIHKAIDGIGVLPVLGGQNLDPKKGTVRNAVAINNQ